MAGPPTPAGGTSTGTRRGSPRSADQWMPAALQALAPASPQTSAGVTNLSAMTVDCMLALVTHTGVSRVAGSVMLGLAGSTVVPFSRADGGVAPASRIVAMATEAWASL